MIGIIDYGMGNLRSVQKALQRLGHEASIVRTAAQVDQVAKLILPGVGAFSDGMQHLLERQLIDPIHAFIASGRPMLGICLGMQLIFESSQEGAPAPDQPVPGLGLLPGDVVAFNVEQPDGSRLKVPHMGWNTLQWDRRDPLLNGLKQGDAFYFVHGYYVRPRNTALVSATCDYGHRFCATVWKDNLWATQFHPEKSQNVGMRLLDNFATIV